MTLVADESVDGGIVRALRAAGLVVAYVAELDPGIPDPEVLALAAEQSAVLLTCDSDFGDLVYRRGQAHAGVLLLRLAGLSAAEKAARCVAAVTQFGPHLGRAFSVLTARSLRIRSPGDTPRPDPDRLV